jgi:catechol 2,3-dioxygenase
MSATTDDTFGRAGGAQPARPGSYGRAPRGTRLPDATRLGPVRLQVADLERSLDFYEGSLGLRVLDRGLAEAVLGTVGDERALVELRERPGAAPAGGRPQLGLYHVALLLPERAALGALVGHLAARGVRLGAGDHLVSEAFYLNDPDGLGLELYADRPRDAWRRVGDELLMATDPVDIEGVLAAAAGRSWTGMPAGTGVGHVHLHVGDLERAGAFYGDGLGFDRTVWSYPGALFFGAGGYHHHLGTNTWAGPRAEAAGEDDARLLEWTIEVPRTGDVDAVARGLADEGFAAARDGVDLVAADPWGTVVRVTGAH